MDAKGVPRLSLGVAGSRADSLIVLENGYVFVFLKDECILSAFTDAALDALRFLHQYRLKTILKPEILSLVHLKEIYEV